jgi:hypothetical protein
MRSLRTVAALLAAGAVLPSAAAAHGPVAPIASSYLARVTTAPPGLKVKVVDGDQRLWVQVAPGGLLVVRDYRGAPYVRLSDGGVEVNRNSEMAYLNHVPAEQVPRGLTAATPPRWRRVSGARSYGWHDGRLHAAASAARAPGASLAGRWRIAVLADGRPAAISGTLSHSARPSLVWLWVVVVVVACVLAARRLRRPELDAAVARALAVAALIAIAAAGLARGLHGRPGLSTVQLVILGALGAFVAWGAYRVASRRLDFLALVAIGFVALWEGAVVVPALWNGFVLAALPAFSVRLAAVLCFACGIGLLLEAPRASDRAAA